MKQSSKSTDNKGFTLIEVLVAVIILAIICAPIFRSFATSARTNARAKLMMKATTAAENLVEEFRYMSAEELIDKYDKAGNTVTPNTYGPDVDEYTFIITNDSDMKEDLPDNYFARVKLDATKYPNANSLNLSKFGAVSVGDAAIFTMTQDDESTKYNEAGFPTLKWDDSNQTLVDAYEDFDYQAYQKFLTRNQDAHAGAPGVYNSRSLNYFKENLTREINVTVDKVGTMTDAEGETVDHVRVTLEITYELKNFNGTFPEVDSKYTAKKAVYFDNAATKAPLKGVYIFFNPRYVAALKDSDRDVITVKNHDNVPFNMYLIAMNGAEDEALYRNKYINMKTQKIVIEEDWNLDGATASSAAMTLLTNLSDAAPYSSQTAEVANVNANLNYSSKGASNKSGATAQLALHSCAVDGKTLDSSDTPNRIYKLVATIYEGDPSDMTNCKVVVELDGTKLE